MRPPSCNCSSAKAWCDRTPNGAASAIGARLRQLRTRRRLSLAQVAKAVGISVGFLSALERSHMSASVSTLRKLARFYKTNILDFFDPAESNVRLVSPDKRKVLEAGPGVRMELLAWGNTVMEPHLFRIAPQSRQRRVLPPRRRRISVHPAGRIADFAGRRGVPSAAGRQFLFRKRHAAQLEKSGRSETWVLWVNTPPTF